MAKSRSKRNFTLYDWLTGADIEAGNKKLEAENKKLEAENKKLRTEIKANFTGKSNQPNSAETIIDILTAGHIRRDTKVTRKVIEGFNFK